MEGGATGRTRSKTGFQSLSSHESVAISELILIFDILRVDLWMIHFLAMLIIIDVSNSTSENITV
jgi:hypothetical protein